MQSNEMKLKAADDASHNTEAVLLQSNINNKSNLFIFLQASSILSVTILLTSTLASSKLAKGDNTRLHETDDKVGLTIIAAGGRG